MKLTVENFNYSNVKNEIKEFSHVDKVKFAVYCAELVLDIYEKYNASNAPRLTIKAAKNWINSPTEVNEKACKSAAYAVYTAYADAAAYAEAAAYAAYAAADAADAAAAYAEAAAYADYADAAAYAEAAAYAADAAACAAADAAACAATDAAACAAADAAACAATDDAADAADAAACAATDACAAYAACAAKNGVKGKIVAWLNSFKTELQTETPEEKECLDQIEQVQSESIDYTKQIDHAVNVLGISRNTVEFMYNNFKVKGEL